MGDTTNPTNGATTESPAAAVAAVAGRTPEHLWPTRVKTDPATGSPIMGEDGHPVVEQYNPDPPEVKPGAPKPFIEPVFDHLLPSKVVTDKDGKPKLDENDTPITEAIRPEPKDPDAEPKGPVEHKFGHLEPPSKAAIADHEKQLDDYRKQIHWQLNHTGQLIVVQIGPTIHAMLGTPPLPFGRQGRPARVSDPIAPSDKRLKYYLDHPTLYLVTVAEAISHIAQPPAANAEAELQSLRQQVRELSTELEAAKYVPEKPKSNKK